MSIREFVFNILLEASKRSGTVQRRLQNDRNLQRTHIFKANSCLKVHNAHLNLLQELQRILTNETLSEDSDWVS